MKRIITLTLIASICSASAVAQISILSTDMTSIGDFVTRYSDTVPAYGPGPSGAGVTWDFSAAVIEDTAETTVVTVGSTPYASSFSASDYAMTGDGNSFLYFTHNNTVMSTTGAAGDLLGNGDIIETPFSDPLVLHIFPREYGDHFNDLYAFEAIADGAPFNVHLIRLNHQGNVYDTTDGSGTLITPTGTYEALRVKTVDYTTDVIDVQLFPFPAIWTNFANTTDTSTTYSWHTKEQKLAIAEMTFDSIGNPARFTFSTVPPVVTTGVKEKSEQEWTVYPQPATDFIYIKGPSTILGNRAEIYSIDGRLIRTEPLLSTRIAVGDLQNGIYLLRLLNDIGDLQKPIRFMVLH
jgi:hypothetical protein